MGIALETAHSADLNLILAKEMAVAVKKNRQKFVPKVLSTKPSGCFL